MGDHFLQGDNSEFVTMKVDLSHETVFTALQFILLNACWGSFSLLGGSKFHLCGQVHLHVNRIRPLRLTHPTYLEQLLNNY